jgi:hypothetical protein
MRAILFAIATEVLLRWAVDARSSAHVWSWESGLSAFAVRVAALSAERAPWIRMASDRKAEDTALMCGWRPPRRKALCPRAVERRAGLHPREPAPA